MNTIHQDDFDDAGTASLLRRFGQHMRTKRPEFLRPRADPAKLQQRLDAVDAKLSDRVDRSSIRHRYWRMAIAAALVIALGVSWLVLERRHPLPVLAGLRLSTQLQTLRSETVKTQFKSGDRVHIHFTIDRDAFAFVAMLDSRMSFLPISADVRIVQAGPAVLGPFELDDALGAESFVILVSAGPRSKADLVRLIGEVDRSTGSGAVSRESRLVAILQALRGEQGLLAEVITFEHIRRGN